MDPSRVGLNAKTSADFLSAAGVEAAYLQLASVVLQGAAIVGGKANSSAATATLYLGLVKALAALGIYVRAHVYVEPITWTRIYGYCIITHRTWGGQYVENILWTFNDAVRYACSFLLPVLSHED